MAVVHIDQPYDRLQTLSTVVAPDVTINFILPLKDGSAQLKDFMQMFEQVSQFYLFFRSNGELCFRIMLLFVWTFVL